MPQYELTLVVDAGFDQQKTDGILKDIEAQIKKAKGQVEKTEQWGKKILAYPINKVSEGNYFLFHLSFGDNQGIKHLEDRLKLNEGLLRYLVVKKVVKSQPAGQKKPGAKSSRPKTSIKKPLTTKKDPS